MPERRQYPFVGADLCAGRSDQSVYIGGGFYLFLSSHGIPWDSQAVYNIEVSFNCSSTR